MNLHGVLGFGTFLGPVTKQPHVPVKPDEEGLLEGDDNRDLRTGAPTPLPSHSWVVVKEFKINCPNMYPWTAK